MKRHIKVYSSFKIWNPKRMRRIIDIKLKDTSASNCTPYVIEWWIHNICYYLTLPFVKYPKVQAINLRAKDVDLMVKVKEE